MTMPATAGGLTTEGTLALVVERLNDLREQQQKDTESLTKAIESLRIDMQQQGQVYVPRQEWEQRNRLVDERHDTRGREIGALTTQIAAVRAEIDATEKARRAPWWSVAAVIFGGASLLIVLLQLPLGLG